MKKPRKTPRPALPADLPGDIRLDSSLGPRFIRATLKNVAERFKDKRVVRDFKWIGVYDYEKDGRSITAYSIQTIRREHNLWWVVKSIDDGGEIVAAGCFRYVPAWEALAGAEAAVTHGHQRRGIYSAVLRAIRSAYRLPLVSSDVLSPGNARLWAKVGVIDPLIGRYRINPKRAFPPVTKGMVEYVRALILVNDLPKETKRKK